MRTAERSDAMSKEIDILIVEPGQPPRSTVIHNTLEAVEKVLGGPVQIGCFLPQRVLLVCRENMEGLMPNRCRPGSKACISGPFLLCGIPEKGCLFESLNPTQREEFKQIFAESGEFMMVGGTPYADPDDVADRVYALWDSLKSGETMVLTKWGGGYAG